MSEFDVEAFLAEAAQENQVVNQVRGRFQRRHVARQIADPDHDPSSCWCCCDDCEDPL